MKNFCFLLGLLSVLSCNKVETPSFEKIKLSEKEVLIKINDSTLHNAIGKDEIITDEKLPFLLQSHCSLVFMEKRILLSKGLIKLVKFKIIG